MTSWPSTRTRRRRFSCCHERLNLRASRDDEDWSGHAQREHHVGTRRTGERKTAQRTNDTKCERRTCQTSILVGPLGRNRWPRAVRMCHAGMVARRELPEKPSRVRFGLTTLRASGDDLGERFARPCLAVARVDSLACEQQGPRRLTPTSLPHLETPRPHICSNIPPLQPERPTLHEAIPVSDRTFPRLRALIPRLQASLPQL